MLKSRESKNDEEVAMAVVMHIIAMRLISCVFSICVVVVTIVGFVAYKLVAILSAFPLLSQGEKEDNDNSTTSDSDASDVTTTTQMEKTHEIITLQLHA